MVKYVSTYTKGTLKKLSAKDLSNAAYGMFLCCCFFFLIVFLKVYVVGTHLNCINKWMQFKWVPKRFVFIKKKTKSTLAVICGVRNCLTMRMCAVIRSNMVSV